MKTTTILTLAAAGAFAATAAWAQLDLDFDAISATGQALFDRFASDEMKEKYEIASGDQMRSMAQTYLNAFASENLGEVAALREMAAAYVSREQASGISTVLGEWLQLHTADFTVATVLHRQAQQRAQQPKTGTSVTGTPAKPAAPESATAVGLYKQQYGTKSPSERAQKWSPQVRQVFIREGVPEELIWQAEVESSWNPSARSPVGAVGLFQFMAPTAREMGLKTENPDERLDALLNAGAAARYLRQLYGRFHDWKLVLAAYNCGGGRVNKLRRESGKGDAATFDDIYSRLPSETKLYVPKIDALVQLRTGKSLDGLGGCDFKAR